MISPVLPSSLRRTGHELASAFTSVTSSFVPRILKEDLFTSIGPKSCITFLYRFGGASVVGRSRTSSVGEAKMTEAASLLIFLTKKEAITVVGVW